MIDHLVIEENDLLVEKGCEPLLSDPFVQQ